MKEYWKFEETGIGYPLLVTVTEYTGWTIVPEMAGALAVLSKIKVLFVILIRVPLRP